MSDVCLVCVSFLLTVSFVLVSLVVLVARNRPEKKVDAPPVMKTLNPPTKKSKSTSTVNNKKPLKQKRPNFKPARVGVQPVGQKYNIMDTSLKRLDMGTHVFYVTPTVSTTSVDALVKTCASMVSSLAKDVVNRMRINKPTFIIGGTFDSHIEFSSIGGTFSGEAFAPMAPTPGYLGDVVLKFCEDRNYENVVVHEFAHAIHLSGFDTAQTSLMKKLWEKYKAMPTSGWDVSTYIFSNEWECFAELSQIFLGMTSRTDATGGVTLAIIQSQMPDVYAFLKMIYPMPSTVKTGVCSMHSCYTFC